MPSQDTHGAFASALTGDFRPLLSRRASLDPIDAHRASALLALADDLEPPSLEDVVRDGAMSSLPLIALRAWLNADIELLRRARDVSPSGSDESLITAGWLALAEGRPLPDVELPRRLAKQRAGWSTLEATAQAALHSLYLGEVDDGVAQARRVTRMARADGIMLMEYLAALVLARARRHAGKPHLTLRILTALGKVAPAPWQPWIRYERRMAGGMLDASERDWSATVEAEAMMEAARTADVDGFAARQTAFALAPIARELDALREALDPDLRPSELLEPWARGEDERSPGPIAGVATPEIDEHGRERAAVFFVTGPGVSRRVLRNGAGLRGAEVIDVPYALAQARTFTAAALLAGAGGAGIEDRALFRGVYGFAARGERDMSSLRMLIHRVRQMLGERAEVVRAEGHTAVHAQRPIAVPDPRCTLDLEGRVLRYMATRDDGISSKEAADALRMSIRSVQNILRRLLDDGSCEVVRAGREVGYRLEDTTFFEPTLERMKATGLR